MDENEPLEQHEHLFLEVVVFYGIAAVIGFWIGIPLLVILSITGF
jgi:hypothetical protein